MKRIFMYGLTGAENRYKLVGYFWINCEEENDIITRMRRDAAWMKFKNPSVERVFAISESAELANAYKYAKRHDNIETNISFMLKLETEGIRII